MTSISTIVFTDLTGSSAVYEELGDATAAQAVFRITRWVDRMVTLCDGQTIKFMGDGVLARFANSDSAVSAAVALQRDYVQLLGRANLGLDMGLKIGIASGHVIDVQADSYGDTVNLAARLCDMAGAGSIWADESVWEPSARRNQSTWPPSPGVVLPLSSFEHRSLGMIPVVGMTKACSVFQVLWDIKTPDTQLTAPVLLDALTTPGQVPRRGIRLTWLNQVQEFDPMDLFECIHIGRDRNNEFVVNQPTVSRRHAVIRNTRDGFELTDHSSYGTAVQFANAATSEIPLRRTSCVLHTDGRLALGPTCFDSDVPILTLQLISSGN